MGTVFVGQPAKPVEERVPPDILWLLRRAWPDPDPDAVSIVPLGVRIDYSMHVAIEKSAEGYTKIVLALIDRCFASPASGRADIYYDNILDVADPVLLKQYKIDAPIR